MIVVVVDDVTDCKVVTVEVAYDGKVCDTVTVAGVKTNCGYSFWSSSLIARSTSVFIFLPRNVLNSFTGNFSHLISRRAT